MAWAAIFFVLLVFFTAWFALAGKKGTLIGRFAAILAIYILVWLFIAVQSPGTGVEIARFGAGGASEAVTHVASFIGHMLRGR